MVGAEVGIDASMNAADTGAKADVRGRAARHARPKVAVDTVLFAIEGGRLKCYLVQLKRGPAGARWGFIGGRVKEGGSGHAKGRARYVGSAGVRRYFYDKLVHQVH